MDSIPFYPILRQTLGGTGGHCTPQRRVCLGCDIGSLSTNVFETRTATGSELFSLLTCPHKTTFTLISIFSPLEISSLKIWEKILS